MTEVQFDALLDLMEAMIEEKMYPGLEESIRRSQLEIDAKAVFFPKEETDDV